MTKNPVICDTCGHLWITENFIHFEGAVSDVEWTGGKVGPCPRCKSQGTVVSGGIDERGNLYFVQDAYRILTDPSITKEDLRDLFAVIQKVRENPGATSEEVAQQINDFAPKFSRLGEMFRGITYDRVINTLGLLVNVLVLLLTLQQPATREPSQSTPAQKITPTPVPTSVPPTPTVTPTLAPARPTVNPRPFVRSKSKIGRNEPCFCGSGKKYKKCCLPKGL